MKRAAGGWNQWFDLAETALLNACDFAEHMGKLAERLVVVEERKEARLQAAQDAKLAKPAASKRKRADDFGEFV